MWTAIECNTYVPPGFLDSGWSKMILYVTDILQREEITKSLMQKMLGDTEVTKITVTGITYVAPFQPAWHQFVCQRNGMSAIR